MGNDPARKVLVRVHDTSSVDNDFIAKALRESLADENIFNEVILMSKDERERNPEILIRAMSRGALDLSTKNRDCFCFHTSLALARLGNGEQIPIVIVLCKSAHTLLGLAITTAEKCNPPLGFVDRTIRELRVYARSVVGSDPVVIRSEEAEQIAKVREKISQTIAECIQNVIGRPPASTLH